VAFGLGLPELVVIGLVVVLLFGGSAFKKVGSGLGQAIREWRKTTGDVEGDVREINRELKK
jgi:sec-independent protein translocase protein TatA